VVETTQGLSRFLRVVEIVVWIFFIGEFVLRFILAPQKRAYLSRNWLALLALIVPAFRLLRVVRLFRGLRLLQVARGARIIRVAGTVNRGMAALSKTLGKRGFGYVILLTFIVTFSGAAGMYAFEHGAPGSEGFNDFGSALWWTGMVMTTMASRHWPETAEGRVLCLALAVYAFTVFGYVTATLASFFVEQDKQTDVQADRETVDAVVAEIRKLRRELKRLLRKR
jgi:voltage-gated potassium channel